MDKVLDAVVMFLGGEFFETLVQLYTGAMEPREEQPPHPRCTSYFPLYCNIHFRNVTLHILSLVEGGGDDVEKIQVSTGR